MRRNLKQTESVIVRIFGVVIVIVVILFASINLIFSKYSKTKKLSTSPEANTPFVKCDSEHTGIITYSQMTFGCPPGSAYKEYIEDGVDYVEVIDQYFLTKLNYPKVKVAIYETYERGRGYISFENWVKDNLLGEYKKENKISASDKPECFNMTPEGCAPTAQIFAFSKSNLDGFESFTYKEMLSNGRVFSNTVISIGDADGRALVFTSINTSLCDDGCDVQNEKYIKFLIKSIFLG